MREERTHKAFARLTFSNSYHGTSILLNVPMDGRLTPNQIERAWKTLCGRPACPCGCGVLGEVPIQQSPPELEATIYEVRPAEDAGFAELILIEAPGPVEAATV